MAYKLISPPAEAQTTKKMSTKKSNKRYVVEVALWTQEVEVSALNAREAKKKAIERLSRRKLTSLVHHKQTYADEI